jgi:hypothetical protein
MVELVKTPRRKTTDGPKSKRATAAYAARRARRSAALGNMLKSDDKRTPEESFLFACAQTLIWCFEAHGFARSDSTALSDADAVERSVHTWEGLARSIAPGLEGCFKLMKYKLAAFFSWATDQPLPLPPYKQGPVKDTPYVLLGGRFGRYALFLKRAGLKRVLGLATTVLQSKKGFPRPTKEMLHAAEQQAFTDLTTVPAVDQSVTLPLTASWAETKDEGPHPQVVTRAYFIAQIDRAVQDLLPAGGFSVSMRTKPFFPSTSANYIRSRSGQGAVGAIIDEHPELLDGLRTPEGGLRLRRDLQEESIGATNGFVLETERFQERFQEFFRRLHASALHEQPLATPLALPEALKTRVITKGPALLNTLLKPLQKYLWRELRKHRCMQLIGHPVDARILRDVLGSKLPKGWGWLSGDYSSATNELQSWVSNAIANSIAVRIGLSEEERVLFVQSLTGHQLEYEGELRPQVRGQLMGSVTSFPVLCIANFTLCRLVMEISLGRRIGLQTLRLLINGDDCAFPLPFVHKITWESLGAFIGLRASVGKVYHSDKFVNINSTNFAYDPEDTDAYLDGESLRATPFRLVKYVNYGLLLGLKRSGQAIGHTEFLDALNGIGTRHRQLLACCPDSARTMVHTQFIDAHRVRLERCRVPWFLPCAFGGLGLEPAFRWPQYPSKKIMVYDQPSMEDCSLLYGALLSWKDLRYFPSPEGVVESPWKVRAIALRMFEGLPMIPETVQSKRDFDQCLGQACAATLFDSRLALHDLFSDTASENKEPLKRNERFWSSLRKCACYKSLPHSELTPLFRIESFLSTLPLRAPRMIPAVRLGKSSAGQPSLDVALGVEPFFSLRFNAPSYPRPVAPVEEAPQVPEVKSPAIPSLGVAASAAAADPWSEDTAEVKRPPRTPFQIAMAELEFGLSHPISESRMSSSLRGVLQDLDRRYPAEGTELKKLFLKSLPEALEDVRHAEALRLHSLDRVRSSDNVREAAAVVQKFVARASQLLVFLRRIQR